MSDAPIESESDFFQRVKKRTYGSVEWERIEPSNESGFPDTHFVVRSRLGKGPEGTLEFKFKDGVGTPDLSGDLVRGTQKSALIEYYQAGGRRRFFLVYTGRGDVWFYTTEAAYNAILGKENQPSALAQMEEPSFCAWLLSLLKE